MDGMQRRLAACLPASTSLSDSDSPEEQSRALKLLRGRCAIAKGRHLVAYNGYGAAAKLLE